MALSINQNIAAMNSYRNLSNTQNDQAKSLEKLSSGFRINRAADDAAGLAISEGLRSQVGGLKVAARNAQDGISVVQTAEGALTEVHAILQRVRDLGVQAGNDSNNAEARKNIDTEATQLVAELDRIGESTNFNGTKLLDGGASFGGKLSFQVGANGDDSSRIDVDLTDANVKGVANALKTGQLAATGTSFAIADVADLAGGTYNFEVTKGTVTTSVTTGAIAATPTGVEEFADALTADEVFSENFTVSVDKDANGAGIGITVQAKNGGTVGVGAAAPGAGVAVAAAAGGAGAVGLKFDTHDNAQKSIDLVDQQIELISTARAGLGALQNRFEHTIKNINVSVENLSASESRIRDTDMASEMMNMTRSQILSQAGTAMLSQANQIPQGVLSLLR